MTLLEALGRMLTTPLGCGGGNTQEDVIIDGDVSNVPYSADAMGGAETDTGDTSCYSLAPTESAGLKLNEILYNPDEDEPEWIELFNKSGQPINVKNFTITNREAAPLAALPDLDIPPCGYMVVPFDAAQDAFDNSRDEVALYSGEPSKATVIDFVAYSGAATVYEGHAFKHAKEALIWKEDDFFSTTGSNEDDSFMSAIVAPGETIGRDRYSTDLNISKDWAGMGGADGLGETIGTTNFTPVTLQDTVQIKPQKPKKWTLAVYMAADNDLQPYGFAELKKLEAVGSTKNVNIAVLADFATIDLAPKMGALQTSAKIYIKKDDKNSKGLISDIELIDEADTGEAETLSNFLDWVKTTFPAKRYFLLSWGHGAGWKGFAFDHSNGHNRLTMGEMAQALENGPKFEIIAFQNCLMGTIEVADQLKNSAKYLVASEEVATVWNWGGWPWDLVVQKINAEPDIKASDLAKFTVTESEKSYAQFLAQLLAKGTDPDITTLLNARTISAVNLGSADFNTLISEIKAFAEGLRNGLEDWGKLKTVHDNPADNVQRRLSNLLQNSSMVDSYPMRKTERPDHRDIYRLAEGIEKDGSIDENWKSHAQKIMDLIEGDSVVIAKKNGGLHHSAMGLSIYFPKAHTGLETGGVTVPDPSPFDAPLAGKKGVELYAADDDATAGKDHPFPPAEGFPFPTNTGWGKFLHRYYNPVADASCVRKDAQEMGKSACEGKFIDENGDGVGDKPSIKLKATGSSDSDGKVVHYYWDFDAKKNTDADDYDKDNDNDAEDDNDAKDGNNKPIDKPEVEFTCPAVGDYTVRLMVWDDHNTKHSKHFQVDSETVEIKCVP